MVGAALEGRRGIGIELEQKYFDVAKKRVEEAQMTFTPDSTSGIIDKSDISSEETKQ
jgi:DNA modification methylase